jgi:NAD dependent epimerase/dehydratase
MKSKNKILVTGADGFIGSHLVESLVHDGYDVKAFVYYNSFDSWGWLDSLSEDIKKNIEVFSGDVRDPFCVNNAMKDCSMVFHLAALIAIPYSYYSPQSYVDTNIQGTLNVLQAGRDLGIEQIIHTSTSEVYGTARFVPITEEHPLQGQSPYSASKIAADQLALSFHKSFDLPVSIMRPFNTYGPRQSTRAVIPTIITQILNGTSKISLGKISPTRDFNYVGDTVNGFKSFIGKTKSFGEVINIGSNFEVSIEDTALLIAELMGAKVTINSDEDRKRPEKSEVERLLADNSKALSLLDWKPELEGIDGLKDGLINTIRWFETPGNLAKYKIGSYTI